VEDAGEHLIAPAGGEHLLDLGRREGVHLVRFQPEPVAVVDERDARVEVVAGRDDGPEVADVIRAAQQHLHQAQRHERLATRRLHRSEVQVVGHSQPSVDRRATATMPASAEFVTVIVVSFCAPDRRAAILPGSR
jgi:Icc-related predicted phosphoesterase